MISKIILLAIIQLANGDVLQSAVEYESLENCVNDAAQLERSFNQSVGSYSVGCYEIELTTNI